MDPQTLPTSETLRAPRLADVLTDAFALVESALDARGPALTTEEVGRVMSVGQGVARVAGLPGVRSQELVRFPGNFLGMAFNLDPDAVGVVLLDRADDLRAGDEVRRTGRVLDVAVGPGLLGRVVDGVGRPLDGLGPISATERLPVERPAPPILARAPVRVPLQTGIKVIDALIPIGRGQRELILGDRQTGKTAIALDTMLNQHDKDMVCIYCAIGQRGTAVGKILEELRRHGALRYCLAVVATEEDPPGLQFVTPYAAMSIGESFSEQGRDVLVVLDDLTRHARAYRELSLLLRRPPGREAYPGDVFYVHSRLLERSTRLKPEHGKGSLTALPIAETEAQNLSAYIPTNLISITDGQIYLSPDLFAKAVLPAVDVGKSVSRVGGKTQLPAYRAVSGELRLSYSQFAELEGFARFGTRLDPETRRALERGRRVREVLKQDLGRPLTVSEQVAVLLAVTAGAFDALPVEKVSAAEDALCAAVRDQLPELCQRIEAGEKLGEDDREAILALAARLTEG
jgi:F-type H+-transporting ATPase subunit alpha